MDHIRNVRSRESLTIVVVVIVVVSVAIHVVSCLVGGLLRLH